MAVMIGRILLVYLWHHSKDEASSNIYPKALILRKVQISQSKNQQNELTLAELQKAFS